MLAGQQDSHQPFAGLRAFPVDGQHFQEGALRLPLVARVNHTMPTAARAAMDAGIDRHGRLHLRQRRVQAIARDQEHRVALAHGVGVRVELEGALEGLLGAVSVPSR